MKFDTKKGEIELEDNREWKIPLKTDSGADSRVILANASARQVGTTATIDFLGEVADKADSWRVHADSVTLCLMNGERYEHNTEDPLLRVERNEQSCVLKTGNLIGFVRKGRCCLKISSRFGDHFLRYILADADGFLAVKDWGGETYAVEESQDWLLPYVWNLRFRRAYHRLGLPKRYVQKCERLSGVRGRLDPLDYLRHAPGKVRCSYRELDCETATAALIATAYQRLMMRGTYTFLQASRPVYQAFLTASQGIKLPLRELLAVKPFTNPFYGDYNGLIDLSMRVLHGDGNAIGDSEPSDAFLFDISMLFEYFVRKLLERSGFTVMQKFATPYRIPTGVQNYKRKLEPDIVLQTEKGCLVFDVKYKNFDQSYGVNREDLFQLHTYIGQYGNDHEIRGCGFIYPMVVSQNGSVGVEVLCDTIKQQQKAIPFRVFLLKIPALPEAQSDSTMMPWEGFVQRMNVSCQKFVEAFRCEELWGERQGPVCFS